MRTQKVEMAYAQAARLRNLAKVLAADASQLPADDPLRKACFVRCETYEKEAQTWLDSIMEEVEIPEQLKDALSPRLCEQFKHRIPS